MANIKRNDTSSDVADLFDVHEKTIRQGWVKRGCPHERREGRLYFDAGEVAAWMQAEGVTGKPGRPDGETSPALEAARLRKTDAMARNWELRNLVSEGQLIDLDTVTQRFGNVGASLRSSLESMGEQIAHLVVGKTATEAATIIDTETARRVDAALNITFN